MEKILITGTSGFIGRHIREKLALQYEVLTPSRNELNLLDTGGVEEYLRSKKVDIIIHSAVQRTLGLSEDIGRQVLHNNLIMFCNLERCNQCYKKMFFIGSGAEYGKDFYIPYMKENYFDSTIPGDDYGFSKYIMTKIARGVENIYNLRVFGIFGPYEDYNYRFISNTICKALNNIDIIIHRNVKFDYLYVEDFCSILKRLLEMELEYKEYNICTGVSIKISGLARLIRDLTGSSSRIIVEQEELGREYSGDNSRVLSEIGGYEFTPIKKAVLKLIDFYRKNDFELRGNY